MPNALVAADALRDRFPGGIHLLREESKWWESANWKPFTRDFAEIHAFPKVTTCRGLKDLPRLYRENVQRQQGVGALPINPDTDVLLCLAGLLGLGNAALSAHPDVYKILCVSQKAYGELTRRGDRARFRFTTSGWLQNRVVEPLAGVERTIHYKPRINPGGDGVRLRRLQKDVDEVFDVVVYMSNGGRELPPDADDWILPARFPSIAELRNFSGITATNNGKEKRHRVIFFGTPFLLVQNLEPEIYIEHLNRCLDYIRRFSPNCDLIYRPHPAETDESKRIKLDGFRIENDREVADLYFLRHFAEIEAVYSVSSTVSRTALNNGLNSYALWRCFPFSNTQQKFFQKVMGDVPLGFEVADLKTSPVTYQDHQQESVASKNNFASALNRAVDLRVRTDEVRRPESAATKTMV